MGLLKKWTESELFRKYDRFRSSIYGRVVFIIVSSFIVLFILYNIVFRSVYMDFFNANISQSGNNISSLVEGSLYYSMLENDNAMLQRTLDIISTMSGIDEVNMYNATDSLAFTSLANNLKNSGNPNCMQCHNNLNSLFPEKIKAYRIINQSTHCGIFNNSNSDRYLLIRKQILNEKSCFTAACHVHQPNERVLGSLIIKLPLKDLDSFVDEASTDFLLLAALITVLLIVILIIFTQKRIKQPLFSIIRASEAVSSGNREFRIEVKSNFLYDIRKVAIAFNNMLENIDTATKELKNWSHQLEYKVQKKTEELSEAQNELIHVERIASLGKLSSSVAHEINNPLSGILIYTKLVYKQLNNPKFSHDKKESILKNLKYIETETKRCGDIVKGLLDFSRKDQDDFEVMHLHKLLDSTYSLMLHSIKIADIGFKTEFMAEQDLIFCSPNQIKQAFVALLVNASEAIHENGEIIIRTMNLDKESITVKVIDNGTGISQDDIQHIFEPFFSTKQSTSGIGLGLAIVHGIIENHKGKIDVDSSPGKGTTLTIQLPLNKN